MKGLTTLFGFALAAAVILAAPAPATTPGPEPLSDLATGKLGNLNLFDDPKPVPEVRFVDADERPRTLADFSGRVVLLNVWATWCAPCRREMPSLDRLQAALGGQDFQVVALAVDRGGLGKVVPFLDEVGVRHLEPFVDTSNKAMRSLGIIGLPTTLLIDQQGREVGRLIGPAEWDAPEALALIEAMIRNGAGGHGGQDRAMAPKPLESLALQ